MSSQKRIETNHIANDFLVESLDHAIWSTSKHTDITTYWLGDPAPMERYLSARLLWSDTAFYVRFEASQNEPLIVSGSPCFTKKTLGLWERDVCEIFVAPNAQDRNRYFEFEIAPTGEWLDLAIHMAPENRETDWHYSSEMTTAARIEKDRVLMACRIPWEAFGRRPCAGDIWLGNLFRCVGKDPNRGYLAWRPTRTPEPNFHVPDAFGEFEFVD
jgi:Carbohydrate-binding family 9